MSRRYWEIRGFDSTEKIYEVYVPVGCLSERQLKEALRALAARAGLSLEEIIGAYARRRTRIANDLLEVTREGPFPIFMCGQNPHFIARVVNEKHEPIGIDKQ